MFTASAIAFALSVLNLLFCAGGLLLTYFDWNAARRREYLYLYFTEEKPSYDYFSAARRRRIQYTRLLAAFFVLSLRQFLALLTGASVIEASHWTAWLEWWRTGQEASVIALATGLQPWLGLLEAGGLALLGYALLTEWSPNDVHRTKGDKHGESSSLPLILLASFVALWSLITLGYVLNAFGGKSQPVVQWATLLSRVLILSFLLLVLRRRALRTPPAGLLVLPTSTVTVALAAWILFPTLADLLRAPIAYPIGLFFAYAIIVGSIARASLGDYESMELMRHRMGRERDVLSSFLKRLGAAFTTDVEVDQILRIILESALDTTDASAGALYLVNTKSRELEPRVVLNFFPPMYVEVSAGRSDRRTEELEDLMKHQNFRMGQGIIGEVAQTGRARLVEDVRAEGIMLGTTTDYMRNRSMLVVPLKVRDEVMGVMAVLNKQRDSFGPDDQSLFQALADQASLSVNNAMLTVEVAEQERLRRDLQIARDIQQRLLPDHCPTIPGFDIAARGTSALEVGGDYYDFFWVDEDHLGIVVADVSGKGVYAALVVAMIRSAFRTQAPGNMDVRDVLNRVNTFISEDLRRDMFVTCVYGILEIPTKKFSWARAGHEPIIVTHPEEPVDIISPDGFALGVIGAPEFHEMLEVQTIELHSGDKLLLFTDGLTEAMNSNGEEFGMDRVLESLAWVHTDNGNGGSSHFERGIGCDPPAGEPEEMKHLEAAVSNHVGDAPQSDDLTIVYLAAR